MDDAQARGSGVSAPTVPANGSDGRPILRNEALKQRKPAHQRLDNMALDEVYSHIRPRKGVSRTRPALAAKRPLFATLLSRRETAAPSAALNPWDLGA